LESEQVQVEYLLHMTTDALFIPATNAFVERILSSAWLLCALPDFF